MKIVLVGGAGWIGSALDAALGEHRVVVIDPEIPGGSSPWLAARLLSGFFHTGHICHDADVVVALPALLGSVPSVERPFESLQDTFVPQLTLLSALAHYKLKPLVVFPSSHLVYEEQPRCLYTTFKLAVENCLRVFHNAYDIPFVVLRIGTGYGPKQKRKSVINFYVERALAGKEIPVYFWVKDDVLATVYIDDIVSALKMACEGKFPLNEIYPIVGSNMRIVDIAKTVERLVGGHAVVVDTPNMVKRVGGGDLPVEGGGPPGWKAKVGLVEGILKTAEWMGFARLNREGDGNELEKFM